MIEQDIGCEWANVNGDHISSKRVSSPFASDMPRLASETTATPLIIFVCWYSLIEVPSEFGMGNNDAMLPAAVVARLIVIVEGFAAVVDVRFARAIFVFLCGTSVIAIAPMLPLEFKESTLIVFISLVECVGKTAIVVCACAEYLRATPSEGPHTEEVFERRF
ncbi:hypothetical protein OKW30_001252 [Paraburkholderia sp. Clong3]|uniref:hypothetical protein n=1 Tax=Paraburkholderia sp. Clong3 TaxID=2991061 RepID=UPI003D1B54FD